MLLYTYPVCLHSLPLGLWQYVTYSLCGVCDHSSVHSPPVFPLHSTPFLLFSVVIPLVFVNTPPVLHRLNSYLLSIDHIIKFVLLAPYTHLISLYNLVSLRVLCELLSF